MKSFLTPDEREILRESHRAEQVKRQADRIKTILYLDLGMSYEEVSRLLLLDEGTIRRYEKDYNKTGLDGLLTVHYQGGTSKLTSEQETQLVEELESKVYLSAKEICAYVKDTFQIEYTPEGMVHLLHRIGFVYKKAKQVPGKAEEEKQKKFIEQYEKTKEKKSSNDKIFFIDATHPHHNSIPSYGWIKKGETVEIKSNTGREKLNLNGAVNIQDCEVIIRAEETINADAVINLLQEIELKNSEADNIYIILDNAPYNRAKKVQEYIKDSKIELIFLPSYSPNLNIIERLWWFFKKEVLYNKYYDKFSDFKKIVMSFFENIHLHKDKLSRLLTDNFHIIKDKPLQT